MKITVQISLLLLFLFFFSCKENSSRKSSIENSSEKKITNQNIKPYFDYDEIDYYHSDVNINLNGLREIYHKLENNKIDSLEFEVLIGDIPENNTDSGFVKKLNLIGFRKILLSEKKHNELKAIFVEKNRDSEPKAALKPIFNDLLIFKKKNKIVGFSKLSIRYLQSRIIGSKFNSDYFPTNIEHQQIEKILTEN